MASETVTIAEACAIAGVCKRTVYNWIAAGKVTCDRIPSGRIRIVRSSLPRVRDHVYELIALWRETAGDVNATQGSPRFARGLRYCADMLEARLSARDTETQA